MADEQYQNDDANGEPNYDGDTDETTTTPASVSEAVTNPLGEDYSDEKDLPDVTVKLIINDGGDSVFDAAVTDIYGNIIPQTGTPLIDSINNYTASISQGVYDELSDATGKKHWWGSWTSRKVLYVILIALCIIAIILAILFLVLGKKFKKNKRSAPAGTTTVTRSIVTKGVSPDPKYQPVRNV